MEETMLPVMDTGNKGICSSYDLRPRTVTKHPSISNTQPGHILSDEDIDMEDCSQESISMLEGLYQSNSKNDFPELIETCINSELETIEIYSDDEQPTEESPDEETISRVDSSTQTSPLTTEFDHPREAEIAKHANFIKSVVRLKAVLSSKEPVTEKQVWEVLQSSMKPSSEDQTVPKETINYLIRSSDVDNVFGETVRALLQHLDYVFCEDFLKIASCWKDSIYDSAVRMLTEAVDNEVGVWKIVDTFLCEKIGSILKDAGQSKNFVLESKANVIKSFCQSTHLSYTASNFIIKKLEKLKTIKPNAGSVTEKISRSYLTKNSYFLLRILEFSLNILKDKLSKGKIDEVFMKKPEEKNYNVLEMWKKHWKKNEEVVEDKTGHDWEAIVSRWCSDLDEVLMHCVNYIPVLSMAVERCGMLAKDLLKLCHPELLGKKTENEHQFGK